RDAAGNWSVNASTVLQVRGPLFFSTFGNTNPPGVAGTADDADLYNWSGPAFSRASDASAAPYNLPGGANVDGFDRVSATQFYMSFSASNTTVPGLGAVQDEDVVFYDSGTWSVYFDGTAHGLTAANQNLDAISIVGGTLFFSTAGNTNPPGVAGVADDADIYSWNGKAFARTWDASANGLAAGANVDGFVRVDATHFYLSFSADTTVPVMGAVQDEDVVYSSDGFWSVYFDGTAHGLGASGNLDVDAFDLP
ncbi:MAG: bacillopeptidase, partial [Microbacteriaceae bacterium]|nr:bacillopeptidase [Microbacteriaceae bacterium]